MTSWCPAKYKEDEALRIFQTNSFVMVKEVMDEPPMWDNQSISTNLCSSGVALHSLLSKIMQGCQGRLRVLQWRWTFCMQSMWSHHAWFHVVWFYVILRCFIIFAFLLSIEELIQSVYLEPASMVMRADPARGLGRAGPFWCKTDLAASVESWAAALMWAKTRDWSLNVWKAKVFKRLHAALRSLLHSHRCSC